MGDAYYGFDVIMRYILFYLIVSKSHKMEPSGTSGLQWLRFQNLFTCAISAKHFEGGVFSRVGAKSIFDTGSVGHHATGSARHHWHEQDHRSGHHVRRLLGQRLDAQRAELLPQAGPGAAAAA